MKKVRIYVVSRKYALPKSGAEAIEKYGILPIHRRTFLKKRIEAGKLIAKENPVTFDDPVQIMNDFLGRYGLPD